MGKWDPRRLSNLNKLVGDRANDQAWGNIWELVRRHNQEMNNELDVVDKQGRHSKYSQPFTSLFPILPRTSGHVGKGAIIIHRKETYNLTRVVTSLAYTIWAGRNKCHIRAGMTKSHRACGNKCLSRQLYSYLSHRGSLFLEEAVRDHTKILLHKYRVHRPNQRIL